MFDKYINIPTNNVADGIPIIKVFMHKIIDSNNNILLSPFFESPILLNTENSVSRNNKLVFIVLIMLVKVIITINVIKIFITKLTVDNVMFSS